MTEVSTTVLLSFGRPGPKQNPYLALLAGSFPARVKPVFFSWKGALFGDYDVFHVQWLELFASSRTGWRGLVKRVLLARLIQRLRRRHTPVLVTKHNERPHEGLPERDRRNYDALSSLVTNYITLNAHTETPREKARHVIPHGHYQDWYSTAVVSELDPPIVLFFGQIRPYKNIEDLIDAFSECSSSSVLRIMGEPINEAYAADLQLLVAGDPRIELKLGHLDDQLLADEIGRSALVALPYRTMHNSGAALLALSLSRPVLVTDNAINRDLQEEVGPNFVHLFDAPLSEAQLSGAMRAAAELALRPETVDLSARDWPALGDLHALAYEAALSARNGAEFRPRH